MAKEDKLMDGLRQHLQPGEEPLRGVLGTYETKMAGQDWTRAGILVATDRQVVFYAKKMTGYDLESFPYSNISSLEMGKNMMGHHIKFFASGNEVRMKWIKDANGLQKFIEFVRDKMASAPSDGGAAAPAQESTLDKLKKLGELKDAGVISDAEFEATKAKLLTEL